MNALVHNSNDVGDPSIVMILKFGEGMHFSRSKNAHLRNLILMLLSVGASMTAKIRAINGIEFFQCVTWQIAKQLH